MVGPGSSGATSGTMWGQRAAAMSLTCRSASGPILRASRGYSGCFCRRGGSTATARSSMTTCTGFRRGRGAKPKGSSSRPWECRGVAGPAVLDVLGGTTVWLVGVVAKPGTQAEGVREAGAAVAREVGGAPVGGLEPHVGLVPNRLLERARQRLRATGASPGKWLRPPSARVPELGLCCA